MTNVYLQGIMGILFYIKSPAFLEDLYIPEEAEEDPIHFIHAMEDSYSQVR